METQRVRFVDGAVNNGYSNKDATSVYDLIESFGGYGFNKSHSVAYALLAYRTAYLKTYFCADFLATCMTVDSSVSNITKIHSEALKLGINFHLPDINQSVYGFKAIDDHNIRYGLGALRQIGHPVVNAVVSARDSGGDFTSLGDFCQRVNLRIVGKAACQSLICSGAFDSLNPNRAESYANLDFEFQRAIELEEESEAGQMNLFGTQIVDEEEIERQSVEPWKLGEKLRREYQMLGLYVSAHPLELYNKEMKTLRNLTQISEISNGADDTSDFCVIYGWVNNLQKLVAKRGGYNVYFELLDLTGEISVTIFSEAFAKCESELKENQPVVVVGSPFHEKNGLPAKFTAHGFYDLNWLRSSISTKLIVELEHDCKNIQAIQDAMQMINKCESATQEIEFKYHSREGHVVKFNPSNDWKVRISDELLAELKTYFGEEAVTPNYSQVKIKAMR